jgi:hypothetical protein
MPTEKEVEDLAEAMWQLLDNMGEGGKSVCLAAKAQARIAYEPFNVPNMKWADWMSLEEAKRIRDTE